MEEEAKNNENKKKQKVLALVGLVTLLLAVFGATYAFFQINTDNESSNTTITGSTPPKSLVTLKQEISNLHLNISASDMSLNNVNNEYYATNVDEKSYEDNESDGTKKIAEVELSDGEATTEYNCTAKLTVSRVTEEENADTMIKVLQPGDMILQFKGNIISNILDLSMLKETGKIEYNLKFKVTGNTPEEIQAYIKLINKETQQNYLSGSKLNIDINTSDLKCEVALPDPKIAQLRAKDIEVSGGVEHLTTDEQGGMYRYQGTDDVPNWICFGTTDKEQCTNEDTGIDKYMYRIIGITEEGQMYLLKETFLKENAKTKFLWNSTSKFPSCLGVACEWPNSDIYKRLNGTASNGNPIFVDSSEYGYMAKDGDWYNLIADHKWMYGDLEVSTLSGWYGYVGSELYAIETGGAATKRIWPDEEQGQETCSSDSPCTENDYTWSKSVPAKIGLMYMHDIDYAYTGGKPISQRDVKNSWIHFQKDGYNTSDNFEWLITRAAANFEREVVDAYRMDASGSFTSAEISRYYPNPVRPVFYLSSNVKIKNGTDGTKTNPYILN